MEKEKKVLELIALAEKYNCFRFSDLGFNTRSGVMFKYEIDLRKACDNLHKAKMFLKHVYNLIIASDPKIDYFMGIPDTGNLLSFVLNVLHQEQYPEKEIPLNLVRTDPKPYIKAAPVTVNPVIEAKNICLIEDDVVTGETLIQYLKMLKCLPRKRMLVVSIFDRDFIDGDGLTVKHKIQKEFDYSYFPLVKLSDLENYFQKSLR
ncbi:MAG: hypothetical protein ACEPOW_08400 [Bacteroidales bacterium]